MTNKKRLTISILCLLMLIVSMFAFSACGGGKVENFNLSFKVDGENYSTISTNGSEIIAIPENPSKEGYTFDGWYWDKDVWNEPFTANSLLNAPISSDMSVYAKFNAISYDITYETDNGTHSNPVSYTIEDSFTLSNAEKNGYNFVGWYSDDAYTTEVTNISAGSMGAITLYAKYEVATYSITYENTKDATNNNVTSYTIESSTITLENLEKLGYTFDGWYNDGRKVTEIAAGSTGNLVLTAQWTPVSYSITYENTKDATNNNVTSYTIESSTITLENLEKLGYTFDGWYNDGRKVTEIAAGSTGNLVLTAQWTPVSYSITYENTKDATNNNVTSYTIESSTITLENLEKLGYTFDGWYNDGRKVTEIAAGSTGNLVLTAQWTPIGYEIKYHNIAEATHSNPDVYDVEDQPLALSSASKTGYTFTGWYTDSACQNKITEVAIGTTGELNLYAGWEIIEYTATFKDGGNTVEEITFTVETETINEPSVPTHNGYNGKWADYVLGTNDITINAEYTPIVYTITYENTKNATNTNVTSYSIESATITFENIAKLGYTFDGWYNNGTKVTEIAAGSTGNLVLTAQWTAIQYNITYMYDDAIGDYVDSRVNPNTYTVEDDFEFIGLVNKTTGYTFDGWYTEKNTGTGSKVAGISLGSTGDITIYAHWALDEYTITYHNASGITNTNATTYTIETDTFSIYDISKEGYVFNGWYSDSNLTTKVTEIAKGTTGNIDLYAKWTPIEYTIEYVLYGGTYDDGKSNPTSYTIETIYTFAEPTLAGYVFGGWYTSADYLERIEKVEGNIGNITLYAKWVHISTITFVTNGGNIVTSISAPAGTIINLPHAEKDYYDFAAWYTDSALTNEFTSNVMPNDNVTLYAKYTPTVYTITYVLNDGVNAEDAVMEYTYEDTITLPIATKTGHSFVGWFTNGQFTSSVVSELKNSYGDITLYANYSINKYTISFDTNGGTEVEPITQNYNTSVNAPSSPAKNGYRFAGWYSDISLNEIYEFTVMSATDITLYAKWELETYNIIYNLSGGINNSNNPSTFTIESADIILQNPQKAGYNFAGWYSDSEYKNPVVTIENGTYNNVEVFAQWEIINYNITYVMDENAINENATQYTVETDLAYLADANLKGHTFGGWYKDSSFNTRVYQIGGGDIGNLTLYAKFTANTYNVWLDGTEEAKADVSFDLNGASGSIPTQTITESTTLVYPTIPTRSGYVFGGWYDNKDCIGGLYDFTALIPNDITLYAKWVKADNLVTINSETTVTLNGKNEQKYVFVPLTSGNVTFTATGSYDTYGILYDATGNLLKQDDDTGTDDNFQIIFNVTAGEVYTISVRGFSSSVAGNVTLHVSGSEDLASGGYVVTGNKTTAVFGQNFTAPVPTSRDGYKFLGYKDANGIMYTDENGNSIKVWDKDSDTVLISEWEETVYSVTFETSGGTKIETIYLPVGARFDISKYVTVRDGYTFNGWYLDGVEYNATTMPGYNITLTAKWKTFALGTIKYDADKLAVSVNDVISADLFDALCLDTNGNKAEFTVSVSGTQAAGEKISVRLTATSGGKTKVVTISNISVYGMPTLSFDENIEYFNINDGLTADWFNASGTDTFGAATEILVYIEKDYKAGDTVTVTIASVDAAGNITYGYVENVKAYGLPEITYDESKIAINLNDTLSAALFEAVAQDSFGNKLEVNVALYNGSIAAGNMPTIRLSATDEKGNVTTVDIVCKVYGLPTISDASKTDVKTTDVITADLLGIIGTDTFNGNLEVVLSVKDGSQTAGSVMIVTATVTDISGNTTSKDYNIKVYGTPTITYDRDGIKLGENATINETNVIFDLNYEGANNAPATQKVTYTTGVVYPEIPLREGFVFTGWYTTPQCETVFDFSASLNKDVTVYAGWKEIATTGYGNYVIDVINGNNSSSNYYSFSTSGTSSSNYRYTYFTALESGSYTIYYKNSSSSSSYGTYIYIYNVTQGKVIKSNSKITSTSYASQTFTANAGDVIYVRNYRYSTSYNATFSMYVTGVAPEAGGLRDKTGAYSVLNAIAKDSFGNEIDVVATVKSGDHTKGTYVVYTLTAVDHLGNTYSIDTSPIGIYDISDIKLDYSYGMSDLIKLTSKGEEFDASATDTFGGFCDITIEAADGYVFAGGNTISLYLVATDKAGNSIRSELIADIKVFATPRVEILQENNYIFEDTSIDFLFSVFDSFGTELYFTTSVEGEQKAGNTIIVTVYAEDDAGNKLEQSFEFFVSYEGLVIDLQDDGTYAIIGYIGDDAVIEIPKTINGITVSTIASEAFKNYSTLTSITVYDTLTSIGDSAFLGCYKLVEVFDYSQLGIIKGDTANGYIAYYANDVYTLQTEESNIFTTANGLIFYYDGTDYYVVGYEGDETELVLPESVELNGNTVTSYKIYEYAFQNQTKLTSVTVPNSVTYIGFAAFNGCSSLTNMTLPFAGRSNESSATEASLFGYIFGDTTFTNAKATKQYYSSSGYKTYYIPSVLTSVTITGGRIQYGTFYACNNLTKITLDTNVSVGAYAFYNCSKLTEVVLPSTITGIANYAFYGCSSLANITLPNTVTSIGAYAFYGCSSLSSIDFTNITSIGTYSFYNCYRLKTITWGTGITSIPSYAFYNFGASSIELPSSIKSIGDYAFADSSLTSISLPSSITSIGSYAFSKSSLTTVSSLGGITSISASAFEGCTSLTKVTMSSKITSIGSNAFKGCTKLTSITIGSGVTSIGSSAFESSGLTSITIPTKVTTINGSAFKNCTALASVTFTSTSTVSSIGSYAFYGCTALKSITIPASVTSIGSYIFAECTALTTVVIGNGVKGISNYAFLRCTALTSITLGSSVTSINEGAFHYCNKLTSITFPASLNLIWKGAFQGCYKLTSAKFTKTTGWYRSYYSHYSSGASFSISPTDAAMNADSLTDTNGTIEYGSCWLHRVT